MIAICVDSDAHLNDDCTQKRISMWRPISSRLSEKNLEQQLHGVCGRIVTRTMSTKK